MANTPRDGDRVLVLKACWLRSILSREKCMEVRGARLKSGLTFFGCGGLIYASAMLGEAMPITSDEHWRDLRTHHRVGTDVRPYKRTFGLPIMHLRKLCKPVRYRHPRGAVGVVKYRSL